MTRITPIVPLIFLLTKPSFGQTIEDIFKSLPLAYTIDLTTEAKDSLMEQGSYIIPGGDSIETMKADYSAEKDYVRLEYSFTTGQNGFVTIELRKFQKNDGSMIAVYSKFGGALRAFDEEVLLTFDYKNGILKLNKNLGLPETIEARAFLKSNLPDSLKAAGNTLSTGYYLMPEEANCIEYNIGAQTNQFDEWIKIDRILHEWNGRRFKKRKN